MRLQRCLVCSPHIAIDWHYCFRFPDFSHIREWQGSKCRFWVRKSTKLGFYAPQIFSGQVWTPSYIYFASPGSSQSIAISVSGYLSVGSRISKTTSPNFTKFSIHITRGRGLVLFWQQCNEMGTSIFVDDVMFHTMGTPHICGCYRLSDGIFQCVKGGKVCYRRLPCLVKYFWNV